MNQTIQPPGMYGSMRKSSKNLALLKAVADLLPVHIKMEIASTDNIQLINGSDLKNAVYRASRGEDSPLLGKPIAVL